LLGGNNGPIMPLSPGGILGLKDRIAPPATWKK
jgi:hypothetical protein